MKQIIQWFKKLFSKIKTNSYANKSETTNAIKNPNGTPEGKPR